MDILQVEIDLRIVTIVLSISIGIAIDFFNYLILCSRSMNSQTLSTKVVQFQDKTNISFVLTLTLLALRVGEQGFENSGLFLFGTVRDPFCLHLRTEEEGVEGGCTEGER